MPGLIAFGRRWSVGSDDIVVPGVFLFVLHFIWFIVAIGLLFGAVWDVGQPCAKLLWIYYVAFLAILGVCMMVEMVTCIAALRGGILNTEKREIVQHLIYARLILMLGELAWLALAVKWLVEHYTECPATGPKEALLGMVISNGIVHLSAPVAAWCTWDAAGRSWVKMKRYQQRSVSSRPGHHHRRRSGSRVRNWRQRKVMRAYQDSWDQRCRLLFCCMRNSDRSKNSFADIARLLNDFFRDLDVVPSDVIAGLVLLRKFQKIEQDAIVKGRKNDIHAYLSGVKVTSKTQFLALNNPPELEHFQDVIHYMHYALGAYGWPIYLITHSVGVCQLCPQLRCGCFPCFSQKDDAAIVDDNCCQCNYAALRKQLADGEVEITYATYHVDVGQTPFFIAVDYSKKVIVISIRGTLSIQDILTDLNAEGETLPLTPPIDDWLGHKGMVEAAEYIKTKIQEERLLEAAFNWNPPRETNAFNLVVVGHSLGGGTAAILAILLKPEYPSLVCFSYSPPGGLLSMPAVQYSKSFTTSVVVGKDVVPRIGLHQMESLRADLINAIKRSIDPKWKTIACSAVCCGCAPLPRSATALSTGGETKLNEYQQVKEEDDSNAGYDNAIYVPEIIVTRGPSRSDNASQVVVHVADGNVGGDCAIDVTAKSQTASASRNPIQMCVSNASASDLTTIAVPPRSAVVDCPVANSADDVTSNDGNIRNHFAVTSQSSNVGCDNYDGLTGQGFSDDSFASESTDSSGYSALSSEAFPRSYFGKAKDSARVNAVHPSDSSIALTLHNPLFPPGRIIHVVRHHPSETEQVLPKREPVYQAVWAENVDFDEVLISPVMVQDHMPDKVLDALNKVITHYGPRKPQRTSVTGYIGISPNEKMRTNDQELDVHHMRSSQTPPHRICLETSFTSLQIPMVEVHHGSSKTSSMTGSLFNSSSTTTKATAKMVSPMQFNSILSYDFVSLLDDQVIASGETSRTLTPSMLSDRLSQLPSFEPSVAKCNRDTVFKSDHNAYDLPTYIPHIRSGKTVAFHLNSLMDSRYQNADKVPSSHKVKRAKFDLIHDDWYGLAPLASPESLSEISSVGSKTSLTCQNDKNINAEFQVATEGNPDDNILETCLDYASSTPTVLRRTPGISGNLANCADDVKNIVSFQKLNQNFRFLRCPTNDSFSGSSGDSSFESATSVDSSQKFTVRSRSGFVKMTVAQMNKGSVPKSQDKADGHQTDSKAEFRSAENIIENNTMVSDYVTRSDTNILNSECPHLSPGLKCSCLDRCGSPITDLQSNNRCLEHALPSARIPHISTSSELYLSTKSSVQSYESFESPINTASPLHRRALMRERNVLGSSHSSSSSLGNSKLCSVIENRHNPLSITVRSDSVKLLEDSSTDLERSACESDGADRSTVVSFKKKRKLIGDKVASFAYGKNESLPLLSNISNTAALSSPSYVKRKRYSVYPETATLLNKEESTV